MTDLIENMRDYVLRGIPLPYISAENSAAAQRTYIAFLEASPLRRSDYNDRRSFGDARARLKLLGAQLDDAVRAAHPDESGRSPLRAIDFCRSATHRPNGKHAGHS